jgi:FkbM family methyltransferase
LENGLQALKRHDVSNSEIECAVPDVTLDVTEDYFLGDRLIVHQPRKGYRAGVDAVMLAASIRAPQDGSGGGDATLLDIGAGVGTVGLCAAARLQGLRVTLLEREAELVKLAVENIAANALAGRVTAVQAEVGSTAGLIPESFDHAVANPPFHDFGTGTPAPNALKAASHAMPSQSLDDWLRFMARMVRPGGCATLIHKAEALPELLAAFEARFGGLIILPIHARLHEPAIRVLVQGIKGSRAPLVLRPPFVLHGEGNEFTVAAQQILRHGGALGM